MELKLNLKMKNLYGGDGNLRFIEEKNIKLTRTKSKKTTKSSTGVSSDSGVAEEQSETIQKEVQTFKLEDGNPTYRLGGIHGKFWGHLKASGKMLADLGEDGFESKAFVDRLMMSLNITPIEVVIKKYKPMLIAEIPQITQGMNKALIIQKFDYLPECEVELKLEFPEMYKQRILRMLEKSEELAGMNKRRATLEILNKKEIFGRD